MKKIVLLLFFIVISLYAETLFKTTEIYGGIECGYGESSLKPCFTDLEGDGRRDILIGGTGDYGGYIQRWEEDSPGSGNYVMLTAAFCDIYTPDAVPDIEDIDRDGKLDLIIGENKYPAISKIKHYEQTAPGSETFVFVSDFFGGIYQSGDGMLSPYICDIENDGLFDVLVGTWRGSVLRYEQTSPNSYNFQYVDVFTGYLNISFSSPFLSDYNNDGLNDLLIGNEDGTIVHYIQDSVNSESYSLETMNFSGIQVNGFNSTPRFYDDIDGNSYPDLMIGKNDNSIEQWSILCPEVLTTDAYNIQGYQTDTGVKVTDISGLTYSSVGVCWSTSLNPTLSDDHKQLGTSAGTFTTTVTGLSNNTTYYLRGYSTDQYNTVYGNQISFTTSVTMSLSTVTPGVITPTSGKCGGWKIVNTGSPLTEVGVCYSTEILPDKSDPHTSGTLDPQYDNFVHTITGLQPSTKYYVRAFITSPDGTVYGEEKYFTTDTTPTLSTNSITGLSETAITSGGSFTSNGGDDITARGLCWNTTGNPTTSDLKVDLGAGYYNFSTQAIGLTPKTKYYLKAYATNGAGTAYGEERAFKTFIADSVPGYCLEFDGVNDYVSGAGIPGNMTAITLEAWIKNTGLPENEICRYVTLSPEVACLRYDGTTYGGYRALDFWVKKTSGSLYHIVCDSVLTTDEWTHIAGTYDGLIMSLYVNGRLLKSSVVNGGLYPCDGNYSISHSPETMHGLIDEVRIWNVARSTNDIRRTMNIPLKGTTDANIISYWQFNNGSGLTATDNGGVNNATLYNMDNASWVTGTLPFGKGESDIKVVSNAGAQVYTGTDIEMNITEISGQDTIVVSKLDLAPNTLPCPVGEAFDSRYWIVKKFGSGSFVTDITLTIPGVLTSYDEANPAIISLYSRPSNSDSEWIAHISAVSANSANGKVTFTGISDFSQLIIARENLSEPENVTTEIAGQDVTITWDAVYGASSYRIFASDDPYGTFTEITSEGVFNGTSWTYTTTLNRKFYFVTAVSE